MTVARDKTKLLIVDDEPSIVCLFKVMLSSAFPDVEIDTAGNGEEAVEMFNKNHYGVLLMDLHMPIMDGRMAFGAIQKSSQEQDVEMPAVVFCTGFAPPESVRHAVDENPLHCLLSKPVTGQRLVDTVKSRL